MRRQDLCHEVRAMKPAQKILLSCRQTSEAASRLIDWLDINQQLLPLGRSAVREDIDALTARLTPLARATESPPGIGVVATPGTGKTELLFAILASRTPPALGQFGQRPLDAATIRGLLPQDHDDGGCVILRFSASEMPPAPRGYPVRVGLLSIIDIAAIVTRAAASAMTSHHCPATGMAGLFETISGRLSPQAIPGLSERDIVDLRETLNSILPDHPLLAGLAANRYWDQFRESAPHITERDRRLVFSVLWGGETTFTAVFNRLCDGLDQLGHGADAYCPAEALLGKDKATGWMTRHPRSIIQVSTLTSLDTHPGPMLSVMNRYGQAVEVERAILAALIDELPLHIATSRLNDMAPAELLDFPVAPPASRHVFSTTHAAAPALNFAAAVGHFARAKAIHLFERACMRRTVTALIAVATPDREDDTYSAAIGDWVESAQGPTAHCRERVRRGLFIAAAQTRGAASVSSSTHDRMMFMIREVIGQDQDWPQSWTPNRPMTDIHWFSAPEPAAVAVPFPGGNAISVINAASAPVADQTLAGLVHGLALASDVRIKHLQLNQALQDIRRRLRGTVLRYHASNDPAALADWRRGTAVVVQDRLQLIIEMGRLGHLQRALMPRQENLVTAIAAAMTESQAVPISQQPWQRLTVAGNDDTARSAFKAPPESPGQRATRMADAAVSYWLQEMRRVSRTQRLCRDLRIEQAILHHLVDELQVGALRVSLAAEIATAVAASATPRLDSLQGSGKPQENDGLALEDTPSSQDYRRIASYAGRIINAFLEVLGVPSSRNRSATARPNRAPSGDLEVADSPAAGYASSGVRSRGAERRSSRPRVEQWEVAFLNLVEDNIAAAHLLVGRGDKDRELGELIQLFAPGPFEVEP